MTTNPLCDHLLVGVSGSIHSLHIFSYLTRFRESIAGEIRVVMTQNARRMIQAETVELFTDEPVFTDAWDRSAAVTGAAHIQLTRWADLFVVVPATANILGKAANGVADDLLSTAILSSPRPVVFAPAMNPAMWASQAVRRNVRTLRADGHQVVDPEVGVSVTSGAWDLGLVPSPETLVRSLQHLRMKALKEEYWEDATREKPLTPAQKRLRQIVAASAANAAAPEQEKA